MFRKGDCMKKLLTLLTVTILVLAGCATGQADSACVQAEQADITMVSDIGGINDKSFNQGTWEGVESYCTDNPGTSANFIESRDESQYVPNLKIAADNSQVVVAAGYTFEKPMYEVATMYPDVNFILIDGQPVNENGEYVELPNVQSYFFNEAQAGYMVGYIAGKTTKTNKIGFIGGMEIPPVQKFGWGFVQGAQAANPDVEVSYQYAGSFADAALGKTLAESMYNSGADIVFTAAGGTNAGVIEAAKSSVLNGQEAWVIGVDRDMYEDGFYTDASGEQKSVILTSATKNVGTAAYEGIDAALNGTWTGGTKTLGYEEGAVGVPTENPNLEQSVVDEASKALSEETDLRYEDKASVEEVLTITINGEI
jgi:basic membrane protein A